MSTRYLRSTVELTECRCGPTLEVTVTARDADVAPEELLRERCAMEDAEALARLRGEAQAVAARASAQRWGR